MLDDRSLDSKELSIVLLERYAHAALSGLLHVYVQKSAVQGNTDLVAVAPDSNQ